MSQDTSVTSVFLYTDNKLTEIQHVLQISTFLLGQFATRSSNDAKLFEIQRFLKTPEDDKRL